MEAIHDKFTASRLDREAQDSFFQKPTYFSSILSTPGKGKFYPSFMICSQWIPENYLLLLLLKSRQSCPTLCDPTGGSPLSSSRVRREMERLVPSCNCSEKAVMQIHSQNSSVHQRACTRVWGKQAKDQASPTAAGKESIRLQCRRHRRRGFDP